MQMGVETENRTNEWDFEQPFNFLAIASQDLIDN